MMYDVGILSAVCAEQFASTTCLHQLQTCLFVPVSNLLAIFLASPLQFEHFSWNIAIKSLFSHGNDMK